MDGIKQVLVLSPHTDDGALGCGATIAKFIEQGKNVTWVSFSAWDKLLPKETPRDTMKRELEKAVKILGLPRKNLLIYDFEVRNFVASRQHILEELIKLKQKLNPEIVLLPSLNDLHQDHHTIAREGLRAFKKDTILGYEEPWNYVTFDTVGFIAVGEDHIGKKLDALKCFGTQQAKTFMNEEFIRGLAKTRGTQVDARYAEAFEVVRWVVK